MSRWKYTKGLHDLGNGCWGYLVPDGSWGWSNAGLIADGDATLLVDTLFDLKCTGEMLSDMRNAVPASEKIGVLVNTHADGDHTFGNQLVKGARIIGTEGTVSDFRRFDPALLLAVQQDPAKFGRPGKFIAECFRPFDFSGIELTEPTETFRDRMTLKVGDKRVELIEVGPAHSLGDALIYVPEDKVLYTGDILFSAGTPIAWYGPIARWIDVCNMVLGMDVDIIVAGHGPISTKEDVRKMRDYLLDVTEKARPLYEQGMDFLNAAYKIDLGGYRDWNDAERVVVTMRTLFDDFENAPERPVHVPLPFFEMMKDMRDHMGKPPVHHGYCDHDH
ncbi:MBL fold metallo-hydrolase [Pseudooceanicola sediminis]|uniref:MBL fold metallo-hydrolase n=1 Tax=Pseudooceanicola sediminis TaxID=2211117 RepID=A0A399IY26_9RHOB|nr:MBL fold metallo-hydrolase [Pseudooceanicola sediminis]KAA2314975.1 MBL fold metallo-hydrolase [Puniceibacterium sp. HSS470]RII37347.1 MBL fold metallo-hydrolase [Pseudooceanicola sediminis]|tara:strand:- start:3995 stop:4993 length:999 start_codon:yes stop_codon:yes gene_type:complete